MEENIINQGWVKLEEDNGIGTITFFNPKSNSLPGIVLTQLAETITEAGKIDAIKVLV